jgi:hypothetical protein
MNLSLAFFGFYLVLHSVHGQEATSLCGAIQKAVAPGVAGGVNVNEVKNCHAHDQADSHIIFRSLAIKDLFSYAVLLQYLDKHNCGGLLVARDFVLTTAHCGGGVSSAV